MAKENSELLEMKKRYIQTTLKKNTDDVVKQKRQLKKVIVSKIIEGKKDGK